jgi:hypothetical protein
MQPTNDACTVFHCISGDQEVSVAYYRSAYATTDYPTEKVKFPDQLFGL